MRNFTSTYFISIDIQSSLVLIMAADGQEKPHGYYLYKPSHILPAVFAALVAISLILHILQNMYAICVPHETL